MHAVQLMPAVDTIMKVAGVLPADLRCVAVATGPGSFTGVRVGIATAKGITAGLGLPLIGVPTLYYTAWPFRFVGLPVRACLPLGRGRVGVASYIVDEHRGLRLDALRNVPEDQAGDGGPAVYCGELTAALRAHLAEIDGAVLPDDATAMRDPAVLAALAWERYLQGKFDAASTLQAEYLDRS